MPSVYSRFLSFVLLSFAALSFSASALDESYQLYTKNGEYYLKTDPTWVPISGDVFIIIPVYEEGDILKLEKVGNDWVVQNITQQVFNAANPSVISNAAIAYQDTNSDGYADIQILFNDGTNNQSISLVSGGNGTFSTVNQPIYTPDTPTAPTLASVPNLSNQEASVGSLAGKMQISNGGEAKWFTNLLLPQGIGGFTPSVSLNYGSQKGNGLMGVGWALGAYGTISRCRRFFEEDGEYRPVEFNNDDRVCLNGQRLKLVSGTNLANGAEYRLGMDATTKVVYSSSTTGGYFTEFRPNGQQNIYGNTTDSITSKGSAVYSWRLAEKQDTFGNSINYSYAATAGYQVRLSEINYSGNQVLFHYSARTDAVKHFYHGESVIKDQRLDWIEIVNHHGNAINSYHMTYQASRMSGRMLVSTIEQCDGSSSGVCLSPTEFNYNDDVPVGFLSAETIPMEDLVPTGPDFANCKNVMDSGDTLNNYYDYCTTKHVNIADTDGDGKKELVVTNGYGDDYYYRVIEIQDNGYTSLSNGQGEMFKNRGLGHDWYGVKPFVINENGDGVDELQFLDNTTSNDYWMWADLDGDGRVQFLNSPSDHICTTCDDDPNVLTSYKYSISDFSDLNGDGLIDRIIKREKWERILDEPPAIEEYAGETLYFAKINKTAGPGGAYQFDSMLIESPYPTNYYGSTMHMSENYTAGKADINGDGYGDSERHGCLDGEAYATCFEFGRFGLWTVDVNGDGIADPVELENGSPTYSLNSWDPSRTTTSKGRQATHTERVLHADFDGDGQPSLVVLDISTQTIRIYRDANTDNTRGDMLVSVKDGNEVETQLTYGVLFNSDRYTPYDNAETLNWNTSPVYDAKGFTQVVTDYEQTTAFDQNGLPLTATTRMYYEGLRQQAGGRGSLGFAKTIRENVTTGIRTETSYRQQYPYNGQVSQVKKQFKNSYGDYITASLYEVVNWEFKNFYSGEVKFVRPKTTRQTQYDYQQATNGEIYTTASTQKLITTETRTWVSYQNQYPLLESISVASNDRIDVGNTRNVLTVNQYNDENLSLWQINRPTRTEVTSTTNRSDGTIDSKSTVAQIHYEVSSGRIDYTEKGSPTDLHTYLKTDFVYDGFGNTTVVANCSAHYATNCATRAVPTNVSADNLHVYRKTTSIFDSQGRYLTEQQNALFSEFYVLSRNDLGQPTSVLDVFGVRKDTYYDSFGREYFSRTSTGDYIRTERIQNGNLVDTVTSSPSAPTAKTRVDGLGRTLRISQQAIDGRFSHLTSTYNALGQLTSTSLPHFDGVTPQGYSYPEYNAAGTLWRTTAADGAITVLSGSTSSLTKTVNSQYLSGVGASIGSGVLNQTTQVNHNGFGELLSTVDGHGEVTTYQFDALGLLSYARNIDGSQINVINDAYGRKISLDDPDKGTILYSYNALDESASRTAPGGVVMKSYYDAAGREVRSEYTENGNVFTSTYTYNGAYLTSEASTEGFSANYDYDGFGRPKTKTDVIDAQGYQQRFTYDEFGRLFQIFDASGNSRGMQYSYQNGYQSAIREASNSSKVYFQVQSMDHRFNITQWLLGNGVTGYETFDPLTGLTTSKRHSKGQQYGQYQRFEFDSLGNLRARQDLLADHNEIFSYDDLNRLETGFLNGSAELTLTYFDNGNIRTKSDVSNGGLYGYGEQHNECTANAGPHALTSIGSRYRYCYDVRGNQLETRDNGTLTRQVTYTSYDKPSHIWSLNGESEFFYGSDRARFKRIDRINGETKTTLFVGSVEVVTDSETVYKRYIGSQALVEVDAFGNSSESYFYHDHIGSIVAITDHVGAVKENLSYDAFGRRRDSQSLQQLDSLIGNTSVANALEITQKGFTGHEHVDHAEVIHMGGRIYDPTVGRFMQADPIVQAPDNGQSLNRYSYVFNNPLSFTDPTGYTAKKADKSASNCDNRGGQFCLPDNSDSSDVESDMQDANNDTDAESASTDQGQTSKGAFEELGGNQSAPCTSDCNWFEVIRDNWKEILTGTVNSASNSNPIMGVASTFAGAEEAVNGVISVSEGDYSQAMISGGMIILGKVKVIKNFDTTNGPIVGGGANLENLSPAEITRIQNAANRTGQEITVVGSRASGNATAVSDWDYVMSGKSSQRHSASSSVPRGTSGGAENSRGTETGIDVFQSYNSKAPDYSPVNTNQPHITFKPQ